MAEDWSAQRYTGTASNECGGSAYRDDPEALKSTKVASCSISSGVAGERFRKLWPCFSLPALKYWQSSKYGSRRPMEAVGTGLASGSRMKKQKLRFNTSVSKRCRTIFVSDHHPRVTALSMNRSHTSHSSNRSKTGQRVSFVGCTWLAAQSTSGVNHCFVLCKTNEALAPAPKKQEKQQPHTHNKSLCLR